MHKRRMRMRGKKNYREFDGKSINSSFFKGLILQCMGLIINDLASPKSKIKQIVSRLIPKVKYDDRKEIKNAKYKIIEGGNRK